MRKIRLSRKAMRIMATVLLMATGTACMAEKSQGTEEKTDLVPKVTGLISLRYSYDESDKDQRGFDVRLARLGAKGNLHKKVDYAFLGEYAGNVRLLDAYVRWKAMPEFSVQFGQFKVPYSQESLGGPTNWLTVEIPTAVSKLSGYNDLCGMKSNSRDIGLMFYGALIHKDVFDVLRYRVGVFNGNGNNIKDNNRKKNVAGLLWISPMRQLSLTGGYHYGTFGPRGTEQTRNRASVGAEWKDRKVHIRSEYLWGNTGGQHSHGVYAQAAYTVFQTLQPVVSYDYFKQDENVNAYQHRLQVGVNAEPINHLRLQAGYAHTFFNGGKHNNLVEVQCIVNW